MTLTIQDLAIAMLKCEQTKGQTVYQHGMSVKHYFDLIINDRIDGRLPSWLCEYKDLVFKNLHNENIILEYTLYHDCGKPHCKIIDADGRSHFPNHAEVSRKLFLDAGGNPIVANLIGWDMVLHCASADEIQSLCENDWTIQDACTLLIASLAEIYSNSQLFGGQETISFKSKFKTLERRGRQICKHYFKESSCLVK